MRMTVLIVDDHPGFRTRVRAVLESEGCTVVGEAGDGESALDEVAALAPDLVLLDVQLPGMDGFAVAERIAASGAHSQVVLTSSRDREDYGARIDASPARGFIAKSELSATALRELLA